MDIALSQHSTSDYDGAMVGQQADRKLTNACKYLMHRNNVAVHGNQTKLR